MPKSSVINNCKDGHDRLINNAPVKMLQNTHFNSKIQRIQIRLNNYKYCRSPSIDHDVDSKFIGRNRIIKKLTSFLLKNDSQKGAFLITGAKGMGKTSLVSKVIHNLLKKRVAPSLLGNGSVFNSNQKILAENFNLGLDIIDERDLLIIIVKRIHDTLKKFWVLKLELGLFCTIHVMFSVLYYLIQGFVDLFGRSSDILIAIISLAIAGIFPSIPILIWRYKSNRGKVISNIKFAIQRTRVLITLIDARVEKEKKLRITRIIEGTYSKKYIYETLVVREIENDLIKVFESLTKSNIQLILIFDELDKLHLQNNCDLTIPQSGKQLNNCSSDTNTPKDIDSAVLLLHRLKHFITTANAQFIFISGRRLHEVYRNSNSDREFTLTSVFPEPIHVESLYTDPSDGRMSDITSMIEWYVCNAILGEGVVNILSHKPPLQLVKSRIEKIPFTTLNLGDSEEEIRAKIILSLYHFVNYLSHVSNGAPKKVANSFERYVEDGVNLDEALTIDKKSLYINQTSGHTDGFFLVLTFLDQQKISFINYLVNPINLAISNQITKYSDRLVVSGSFFINHIFKFHKHGFSWRHFEHSPELMDPYKSQEFRDYIGRVIDFLNHIHIESVVSGIYRYKFPQRITEEILSMSKLSEEISALFNFDNEELTSIKGLLINTFLRNSNTIEMEDSQKRIPDNNSSVHNIIGDLYLFSGDYLAAISEFKISVNLLSSILIKNDFRETGFKGAFDSLIVVDLVRTCLKLGLSYEKRKTYNSAHLIYSSLINILIHFRLFQENSVGLEFISIKDNCENIEYGFIEKIKLSDVEQDKLKYNKELDRQNDSGLIDKIIPQEDLISWLIKDFDPTKAAALIQLTTFEEIRFVTQTILAKLMVLEKTQTGGISKIDIDIAIAEFNFLFRAIDKADKFLIISDFYKKLADILFLKNRFFTKVEATADSCISFFDIDVLTASQKKDVAFEVAKRIPVNEECNTKKNDKLSSLLTTSRDNHEYIVNTIINCHCNRSKGLSNSNQVACDACRYYNRAIHFMMANFLGIPNNDLLKETKTKQIFKVLAKPDDYPLNFNYMQVFAKSLSSFGDALLGCVITHENQQIEIESLDINYPLRIAFIRELSNLIKSPKSKGTRRNIFKDLAANQSSQFWTKLAKLDKVLIYYYLAGIFYKKSSNHIAYSLQLLKVLKIIFEYFNYKDSIGITSTLTPAEKETWQHFIAVIIEKTRVGIEVAYSQTSYLEREELQNIFDLESGTEKVKPEWLTIYNDYEDAVLTGDRIMALLNPNDVVILSERNQINAYKITSTIFVSMLELLHKSFMNRKIYEKLGSTMDEVIKKEIIIDSIFCLGRFLEHIATCGKTLLFTYSRIGKAHEEMVFWIKEYKEYKKGFETSTIKEELISRIGIDSMAYISEMYHMQKALQNYYKAIETHKEGQAYQELVENLFVADDDLNDDLFHFLVALERFRINNGIVRGSIIAVKKLLGERIRDSVDNLM